LRNNFHFAALIIVEMICVIILSLLIAFDLD